MKNGFIKARGQKCLFLLLAILIISTYSFASNYVIAVRGSTLKNKGWRNVVEKLRTKHQGTIVQYDNRLEEILAQLQAINPRYLCLVMTPQDATRDAVIAINQITRQLDDDPYGDVIWGIVTGYTPGFALKMASVNRMDIRRGLGKTQVNWLRYLDSGAYYSEAVKNHKYEKSSGREIRKVRGPSDTTQQITNAINSGQVDIMWTSGHASERDWEMGWAFRDGKFFTQNGQLKAHDTQGREYYVQSPHPMVYYAPGNCLIGHINNTQDCMVLSWIRAGALQFAGYTRESWYGYMGWGVGDYFFLLKDRFTFAESVYLNNQALLFDLEHKPPGINEQGHLYDRDVFVLYGDPALEVRIVPTAELPLYSQELIFEEIEPNQYRVKFSVRMEKNGKVSRPAAAFLPQKIFSVSGLETNSYKVGTSDNFILMMLNPPDQQELSAGEERHATFIASTAKTETPKVKKEEIVTPSSGPLQDFGFESELADWKVFSTSFQEQILPEWKREYHGKRGVAVLDSCSYPARDARLGGPTMSILARTLSLPPQALTLAIDMAKCPGGGQVSGYSDGYLGLYISGQLVKDWYLKHDVGQEVRWITESVDVSAWAGRTVNLEIRGMPGGTGRNCPECHGTCDTEAVAVARILILGR